MRLNDATQSIAVVGRGDAELRQRPESTPELRALLSKDPPMDACAAVAVSHHLVLLPQAKSACRMTAQSLSERRTVNQTHEVL
jgi:hypothetical protein